MVHNAIIRLIICSYNSVIRMAHRINFVIFLKLSLEAFCCDFLVLTLRALIAAMRNDFRRYVGKAHTRITLISVLPALTGSAISLTADISSVYGYNSHVGRIVPCIGPSSKAGKFAH